MFSHALLSLIVASVSLGAELPHGLVTSTATWCQGLGNGAFDTAYNFTVAAYDLSGSNANSSGAPLVLAPTSTEDSVEYMVFSTYASYPDNTWQSFSLNQGTLIPQSGSSKGVDLSVDGGDAPTFVTSTGGSLPSGAQDYCGVANTDPAGGDQYPKLAVNTDTGSFSLCQSTSGQDIVVYQASQNSTSYDFSTCSSVLLQLIGLD